MNRNMKEVIFNTNLIASLYSIVRKLKPNSLVNLCLKSNDGQEIINQWTEKKLYGYI